MNNPFEIKVCGINDEISMNTALRCKANYVGLVFYPNSPRNVSIDLSRKLLQLRNNITKIVALIVDPYDDFLFEIKKKIKPDYIQLHGSETFERVKEIKKMGIKIIKTIKVKEQRDIALYKDYKNVADLILFDSTSMEKSEKIPKDLLNKLPKGEKFGLAGAINLKNIQEYSQLGFNFLDLSSGLEKENLKGYKDHLKIKNFMNKINELKN